MARDERAAAPADPRECAPLAFLPCMAADRDRATVDELRLGIILAAGRRHFLEFQLQLIEKPLMALRARAMDIALHLLDPDLKVLDHRIGAGEPSISINQKRLERIDVVRQFVQRLGHDAKENTTLAIRALRSPLVSQRAALSPPPRADSCARDSANRFLQGDNRAVPA